MLSIFAKTLISLDTDNSFGKSQSHDLPTLKRIHHNAPLLKTEVRYQIIFYPQNPSMKGLQSLNHKTI